MKREAIAPEQLFVLHLTEGQLRVLEKALDLYSRTGMGQIKESFRIALMDRTPDTDEGNWSVVDALGALHKAIADIPIPGGVQGISSPALSDEFRVAYDIQQVVRYGLHHVRYYRDPSYRQNCGAYVSSDPPRRYSAYEPNLPVLIMRAPLQRR